jgi:SAM-dependent methyltransferase
LTSTVDWARDFYSRSGSWWGKAEARVTERDDGRVALLHANAGDQPMRVLELGAGYGTTAVAMARAGHAVTAVEFSDRADAVAGLAADLGTGSVDVVRDDFYDVRLPERFDAVCYFNGFGVGSDRDQRRLLRRIADEWLLAGGVALIDVMNPFVWAGWDGDDEHLPAATDRGYEFELYEHNAFDPVTCTAIDTWWEADHPERRISQYLRCYTPADLALLLEGTGLTLTGFHVGGQRLPLEPRPSFGELLREHHEYLAVLRHQRAAG